MSELDPKNFNEDQQTEFKESFKEPALKALCAFANKEGGSVFVPLNDKGVIVEESWSEEKIEDIANRVINNLGIQPSIRSHHWREQNYIEINVPKVESPIPLKGRYYIRVGNTTQRMNPEQLKSRMLESVPWDTQIVENISLADLDESEIKRFAKSGQEAGRISAEIDPTEPEEILKRTHLLREEGFTNACLLLFGKKPQRHFPSANIRLSEFASETEIINDKTVKGNLFQQVRKSEEVVKDHMKHGYEVSEQKFMREERWTYPLPAIREGIMNAVIHRDYYKQGSQIQVKLFDNRISIFSPGGLPDRLSVDDLLTTHPSVRRNNLLADIFFRAGLIEAFGTGISRIRKSLDRAGLPAPEFEDKGHSFVMTLYQQFEGKAGEATVDFDELNDRQKKALELAEEGSIRTKDLTGIFNEVEKRTIRRDLRELVKKGLLKAKGKTRNRYYELKNTSD